MVRITSSGKLNWFVSIAGICNMKKCIAFAIGLIISGLIVVGLTFDGCFNSHKQTSRVVPDSCLG